LKTALISGGSSGIGKEIARQFAEQGIHVILLARDEQKLKVAADDIYNKKGKVDFVSADVTNVESLKTALEKVKQIVSDKLDVLVNCAGGGPVGGLSVITDSEWDESINIKQMGYVRLTRESLPLLKAAKSASVINVIGVFGKQPHPDFIIGSMTNAALLAFTKAISEEVAKDNITVNAINPGATDTPLWTETVKQMAEIAGVEPEEINRNIAGMSPMGRITVPEDVARVASFLISEGASFITGTSINVDGGTFRGTA
jgi:NAD(P)-dependent dehydrogenase (short-subunit alcohol dehydrogenase family)